VVRAVINVVKLVTLPENVPTSCKENVEEEETKLAINVERWATCPESVHLLGV